MKEIKTFYELEKAIHEAKNIQISWVLGKPGGFLISTTMQTTKYSALAALQHMKHFSKKETKLDGSLPESYQLYKDRFGVLDEYGNLTIGEIKYKGFDD